MDYWMVRLGSMNRNSGLDHFVSCQNVENVTENKSCGMEMKHWLRKVLIRPPIHAPTPSPVGSWTFELSPRCSESTTRFPTIQQVHSRSDIGSNFRGWTTSQTKNRNMNALLKDGTTWKVPPGWLQYRKGGGEKGMEGKLNGNYLSLNFVKVENKNKLTGNELISNLSNNFKILLELLWRRKMFLGLQMFDYSIPLMMKIFTQNLKKT